MQREWRTWLRIVCAIALLSIGFAHKPPLAQATTLSIAQSADYVLPDGSFPVLCISLHDDGDASHPTTSSFGLGCEVCRLSASIILPQPPATVGQRIAVTLRVLPPSFNEDIFQQLFPPNAAPRAPPASTLII